MRARRIAWVVAFSTALACAQGRQATTEPDGGSGSVAAGTGLDAGSAASDAGSGDDGGGLATDAGSGDRDGGPVTDAGSGNHDGGPASDAGPSASGWCSPDGSGPGPLSEAEPGLPRDCAGLMPLPREPTGRMNAGLGTHTSCGSPEADGAGDFAISFTPGTSNPFIEVYDPAGKYLFRGSSTETLALERGFAIRATGEGHSPVGLQFVPAGIGQPWPVVNTSFVLAADPRGKGALAVERPWNLDHFWLTAHRFDAAGNPAGPAIDLAEGQGSATPQLYAAAVSTSGPALVVFSGEPFGSAANGYARWLDAAGRPSGAPFAIATLPAGAKALAARPLVDGSIAVNAGGAWIARVRPGASAAEPAPAWLAALPGIDLRLRPGGRGYLILLPQAFNLPAASCVPGIQVRAPAGNLCGTLGLSPGHRAGVGLDGSLIDLANTGTSPPAPECTFGACCRMQWWTGLFQ